jgi:hypothetical protein
MIAWTQSPQFGGPGKINQAGRLWRSKNGLLPRLLGRLTPLPFLQRDDPARPQECFLLH